MSKVVVICRKRISKSPVVFFGISHLSNHSKEPKLQKQKSRSSKNALSNDAKVFLTLKLLQHFICIIATLCTYKMGHALKKKFEN